MFVDLVEGGEQPLPAFAIEARDSMTQLGNRGGEIAALGFHVPDLAVELRRFRLRAQVDRSHVVPLPLQPFQPGFGRVLRRQFLVGRNTDRGQCVFRRAFETFRDAFRYCSELLLDLSDRRFLPDPFFPCFGEERFAAAQVAGKFFELRFGDGQGVGGLAAPFFRRAAAVEQDGPLFGDLRGPRTELVHLRNFQRPSFRQTVKLLRGVFRTVAPGPEFVLDHLETLRAACGLPAQSVVGAAGLRQPCAVLGELALPTFDRGSPLADIGEGCELFPCGFFLVGQFRQIGSDPFAGFDQAVHAGARFRRPFGQ